MEQSDTADERLRRANASAEPNRAGDRIRHEWPARGAQGQDRHRRGEARQPTNHPNAEEMKRPHEFERHNVGGNATKATGGEQLHMGDVHSLLAGNRKSAASNVRRPIVSSVSH